MKKITKCPGWLALNDGRTDFIFLPERAAIVKKIFELSVAGLGGYTIANQLNAKNIPVFGPSPQWDQSTIHNLLTNRATIGEYQPKRYATAKERSDGHRDRKGTPVGDVIRNYYPAAIEEELFNRAQEARRKNLSSGRGRKGRLITNLFAGIPTCSYCAAPMRFHSNGPAKSLICSTVLENRGCFRMGWSYRGFEDSFFKLVIETELDKMAPNSQSDSATGLKTLVKQALSDRDNYDARLSIALILKEAVSALRMASAGPDPVAAKPKARIRRDNPNRYFEVSLFAGPTHTVLSGEQIITGKRMGSLRPDSSED